MVWAQAKANNAKLALLTNDTSTAVLAVVANNKIIFVHSSKNLGGTILEPINRFAGFIGNGRVALAIVADDSSLLYHIYIATSSYASIIACLDKAEIKALAHPAVNVALTYDVITSFLPAPWLLLKVVSNTNTNDPALIILPASKFAAKFDNEHKNNNKYVTSIEDQLKEFVKWAWGVQARRFPMLNYSVEPENEALLFYHRERHQKLIALITPAPFAATVQPPTGTAPKVFNLLEASISQQANAMEKINTTQENTLVFKKEKETKKKDRFSKFHPSAKQLFSFASAPDTKDVPLKIEDSCEHFMNPTSQGVAEQELNMQFKAMGLGDLAYATGLTLNLYSGKFLYAVCNNPSNFLCFSCHKGTHLDKEDKQNQQLFLHLIKTKGKGQLVKDIKAVNKQQINSPTTYLNMMQQFAYFGGLCRKFFGQYSYAMQAINTLTSYIEKCKQSFKARECTDKEFCSKFMYPINTCYQLWLEKCMTATSQSRVDDSILKFRSIIEQVHFGTFELRLPSVFAAPAPAIKARTPTLNIDNKIEIPDDKKGNKKKNNKRVINNSPPEAFKLAQGETWGGSFANKNVDG